MQNYRYNSSDHMRRRAYPQTGSAMAVPRKETSCPVCRTDRSASCELQGMPLAMAYVPWQKWQKIYEAEKALCRGTIFEELDKPFRGIGGCQNVR